MRMIAPDEAGALYIDHLITATKTDHRYQSPDLQVPFVNKNTENHWLMLLEMSGKNTGYCSGILDRNSKE
nr:CAZy families PL8 protein [uncultured Bacteroides sp.]